MDIEFSSSLRSTNKAIPILAWTSLEGSRSMRLPNFKRVGP
jgi:hypothetical protein